MPVRVEPSITTTAPSAHLVQGADENTAQRTHAFAKQALQANLANRTESRNLASKAETLADLVKNYQDSSDGSPNVSILMMINELVHDMNQLNHLRSEKKRTTDDQLELQHKRKTQTIAQGMISKSNVILGTSLAYLASQGGMRLYGTEQTRALAEPVGNFILQWNNLLGNRADTASKTAELELSLISTKLQNNSSEASSRELDGAKEVFRAVQQWMRSVSTP